MSKRSNSSVETTEPPTFKRFKESQLIHPLYPKRCAVHHQTWDIVDVDYEPSDFTHGKIVKKSGTRGFDPLVIDGAQDLAKHIARRPSCLGPFEQDPVTHRPLNPLGRTGLQGRGLLRNWGPNQAGDALVTRMTHEGQVEFVAIKRNDNGAWAIPGGRLELGELVSHCVRREFEEEACAFDEQDMPHIRNLLNGLFATGNVVYHGVVLDPRTTDNAWMETQCYHVHIRDKEIAHTFRVKGGDDAAEAKWILADESAEEFKNLFANHAEIVRAAVDQLKSS